MLHVSVAYFPQGHMSNIRNNHVASHYLFLPPCSMSLRLICRLSILRKAHVAVSNLRVEGPTRYISCAPTSRGHTLWYLTN